MEENTENTDKTILLRIINAIQIIACIIVAIIFFAEQNIFNGIVILFVGFILFAFIKGFCDIVELLDDINKKMNK